MNAQHPNDNRQILEEASSWFVEFRLSNPDHAKRKDFMRWLKRSPEHIRAYMEISSAYAKLPNATTVEPAAVERLVERAKARSTVVPLDTLSELAGSSFRTDRTYQRPTIRHRVRLAASIAFLCISAAAATWLVLNRAPTYETQVAEHRSITLEDGSRIDLNARTKVRVAFGSSERRVDLLEGQALFQVAKDPARPFIVSGAGTQVQAVGTRFDVNLKKSGTIVTVLEGKVAVSPLPHALAGEEQPSLPTTVGAPTSAATLESGSRDQNAGGEFLLIAGEQAVITTTSIAKPKLVNIAAATAWKQGQLEFDETPLVEVAEEFNRYNRVRLIVESQSLDDFRISGVYSSDDPRSLIRFMYNQPDLVVTETKSEIRIRRR